jgi:hypothetical protein
MGQLHGLPKSKNTGKILTMGSDDSSTLAGVSDRSMSPAETRKIADVAVGNYEDVVRGKWARGLKVADAINSRNLDYKADDGSYELLGSNGGQIQNSNSAAYPYGKGMDLDLDGALKDAGIERRFPGWGRDLLDPSYKPYVAPPTFPPALENRQ